MSRFRHGLGITLLCFLVSSAAQAGDPVSYHLSTRSGRAVILSSDGEVIPWTAYLSLHESKMEQWAPKQTALIDAGVRLFTLATWPYPGEFFGNRFWSFDGEPVTVPVEPHSLPMQAEYLIERVPDARFMVRILLHPDAAWRRDHLEDFQPLRKDSPHGHRRYSTMSTLR